MEKIERKWAFSIAADSVLTDATSSGRREFNIPARKDSYLTSINVSPDAESGAQPFFAEVFLGRSLDDGNTFVEGPILRGNVRGDSSIRQKHGLYWEGRKLLQKDVRTNYLFFALQNQSATATLTAETVAVLVVE